MKSLRQHAERDYPQECCGVLVGHLQENGAVVTQTVPTENRCRDRSCERYEIAPEALLRVIRDAEAVGAEVVGYYHSHPDRGAVPSSTDESSAWSGVSYLIVAVENGSAAEIRSWRFEGGSAAEENIRDDDPERLSGTQG